MKLVLNDGTTFYGESFGYSSNVGGEVVFNTAMVGYIEALTDPSYYSQILVLTYPIQGNYGVPSNLFESDRIQVCGLIVANHSTTPNHFKCIKNLSNWLKSQRIPAICNVDTRAVAKHLKAHKTMPGRLVTNDQENTTNISKSNALNYVTLLPITMYGNADVRVLVIDTGCKENIIRALIKRGASIIRVPWNEHWEQYLPEVDGVVITNGPGDPTSVQSLIARISRLLEEEIPIFGICLGHQLLALAAGATINKLTCGHRSINQPVQDQINGKCYITAQNHGYAVDPQSLSNDWEPWFTNLNDGTNEGIRHRRKLIRSVQFHPEAAPGPNDTQFLFDEFIQDVIRVKKVSKPAKHIKQIKYFVKNLENRD